MPKINKAPVTKGVAKVPVIMQLEALECGAAALDMVLAFYGKWVPIEEVRATCGVSRDGSKAGNIARAARTYGLDAQGYRCEPESLKKEPSFPCIIHWNFNHFVVLCGFKGDKAVINDPAKGHVIVPKEVFDKSFTGVCIQFSPGENFEPSGRQKSVREFIVKRLAKSKKAVGFVVFTTVAASAVSAINPFFSRVFLDDLLTEAHPEYLDWFFLVLIGFSALQVFIGWFQATQSLKMFGKLDVENSSNFFWHLLRLPVDFFGQRMAGDLQGRMTSNTSVANTLVNTVAPLFINTFMMIFYLVIMVRYSLLLSVIGISTVAINIFVANIISKKRINITRVQMKDASTLSSTTVSGIKMIETIKSAGAENGFFEKWSGLQASVNTQNINYAKINYYLGMIPQIVNALCTNIVVIVGVFLVVAGGDSASFTVGMIMAFTGYLSAFMGPVGQIIKSGQSLQEMRTQMERIEDVMNYPKAVHETFTVIDDIEYVKLKGRIEVDDVSFGYCRINDPLIENFSMKLEPGDRVALVGASGCGKSTLSKLISGLYKPWSGRILLDGTPVEDIDHNILTGSLAVVDQNITVFEDSIADNIKMWDNTIPNEIMVKAARDAHIHDDIMERTGGYSYVMREDGRDFSGGQRQRLEIARVLAQNPSVIIMDEATSALDAETEFEVVNDIKSRGITCIIIAHRLSTIRDCDEIIVLDNGHIVERGTHDELVAKNGRYMELITNE